MVKRNGKGVLVAAPDPTEPAESRIRVERRRLGLTQAQVAVQAPMAIGYLSLVERYPALLSRRKAVALARVLGVTPEYLLADREAGRRS
jgi:transcriptional regulator with XRE-family HTH domain